LTPFINCCLSDKLWAAAQRTRNFPAGCPQNDANVVSEMFKYSHKSTCASAAVEVFASWPKEGEEEEAASQTDWHLIKHLLQRRKLFKQNTHINNSKQADRRSDRTVEGRENILGAVAAYLLSPLLIWRGTSQF